MSTAPAQAVQSPATYDLQSEGADVPTNVTNTRLVLTGSQTAIACQLCIVTGSLHLYTALNGAMDASFRRAVVRCEAKNAHSVLDSHKNAVLSSHFRAIRSDFSGTWKPSQLV